MERRVENPLDGWVQDRTGIRNWSREALSQWQLEKIQELWHYVRENSSGYRKLYSGDSYPESWKKFEDLPFLSAEDLKNGGNNLLCVSQSQVERVVTLTTSGTTGEPKRLYFTREDQELTVDFFANGMKVLTSPGETVMILLPCTVPGGVGDLLRRGLESLGARPVCYGLAEDPWDCLEVMERERPSVLVGIPTQILALAQLGVQERYPASVERILASTDYLADSVRRRIQRLWKCQVFDHFGITEAGLGGALECPYHQGMHIRENDLYLEIIDPGTGQVLPPGEAGELVLTTLTRRGMPLIRYRTGDLASLTEEPCSCGSILRRLHGPWARIDQGIQDLTMAELDEILFEQEECVDFEAFLEVDILKLYLYTLGERERFLLEAQAEKLSARVEALIQKNGSEATQVSIQVLVRPRKYAYRGKRRIHKEIEGCRYI